MSHVKTPMINAVDMAERIQISLCQLEAMLMHVHGEGGVAFRALADSLQDNYLWGCADKVAMIRAQAELLSQSLLRQNKSKGIDPFECVLERVRGLCEAQTLIVNPEAREDDAKDALSFLGWVHRQKLGGVDTAAEVTE